MKSKISNVAKQAALAASYFAAGKLCLALAYFHPLASPLWAPSGLAMAAVVLWGWRVWPGVALGALLVNLSVLGHSSAGTLSIALACCGIAFGNTLEALTGAALIDRFAQGRAAFQRPQSVLAFVGLSAAGSTMLSALLGSSVSVLTGLVPWKALGDFWLTWWLGDMAGVILLTPLIVVWTSKGLPTPGLGRAGEAAALGLALVLSCLVAFHSWPTAQTYGEPLSFLTMPVLLWSAFRFGLRGTTLAALLVAAFATFGTLQGHGPFAGAKPNISLLLVQNYLALTTVLSLVLAADVLQRRRSDADMRASEQRYRELFEASPQPMWVHDYATLRFLAVNQAALDHYGYSRREFLSMTSNELRPAEEIPAARESINQAQEGTASPRVWRHRKKDGSLIQVEEARRNVLFDGRPAALVLCQDITERIATEEEVQRLNRELRRRVEELELLFEVAPVGIAVARDPECQVITGNRACAALLGTNGQANLSPASGPGKGIGYRLLRNGQEMPPEEQPMQRAARLGLKLPGQELDVIRADGQVVNSYVSVSPLYDERSRVRGSLGVFIDLTERKRAEAALRENHEHLRLALAVAKMGTWRIEAGRTLRIQPSAESAAIFGLKPEEVTGTEEQLMELIHPEDRLPCRKALARALRAEGEYELEFRILPRNRPLAWMLARGRTYPGGEGEGFRLVGVVIDITARKESEQEILRLNSELERRVRERTAQLEALNKELEAFSYSVSHDLRAPLRSIRGFSEVLLQRYSSKLDPRGQEFLRRACESSQHMDRLIDDLLQLSRVGRSELQCQPVDLSALASSVAAEFRHTEPNRDVRVTIAPDLRAQGDERLLRIALENLLSNAWKFTARQPTPRIEFGCQKAQPTTFFVRDNGAGFDMAYADKLFGVFQRLHSAAEFPGTGVGLATVQRIVTRHGGRTWAEGALDRGATFYFTLPTNEHA